MLAISLFVLMAMHFDQYATCICVDTGEDEDGDDMAYDILIGDRLVKDFSDENALTYLIGYLFKKTIHSKSKCDTCKGVFVQDKCDASFNQRLIQLRCYTPDALVIPTELAYRVFSLVESTFIYNLPSIQQRKKNFIEQLLEKLVVTVENMFPEIPRCHLSLMFRRFIKIRMHFYTRQVVEEEKATDEFKAAKRDAGHASKTVAGYQLH